MVVLSHLSFVYFIYLHNIDGGKIPAKFPVQNYIHNSIFSFLYSGTSAVFIFFVMSGIVLSRGIENTDRYYYLTSFTRYFRLAIPATFSCLLMFVSLFYISGSNYNLPGASEWLNSFIIAHLTLIGAFLYGAIGSFLGVPIWDSQAYNPVLWTIKIELIGSLYVYMACILLKRNKILSLAVFLIVSLALLPFNVTMGLSMVCFDCGFIYSVFHMNYKNNFLSILLIIAGFYFAGIHNDSRSYECITKFLKKHSYLILNFLSGIFIVYGVLISSVISHILEKKWFVYLGQLSFPIYIIHMPVIILTIYLTRDFANDSVVSMLAVSAASIFFSIVLARFIVPVNDFPISFSKDVYNKITRLGRFRKTS